jgi:hypothetical protein
MIVNLSKTTVSLKHPGRYVIPNLDNRNYVTYGAESFLRSQNFMEPQCSLLCSEQSPFLSQANPVHTFLSYLYKSQFNIPSHLHLRLPSSCFSHRHFVIFSALILVGARGSVVGWDTMLQAGRSRVRVPMRWIFFNWPNPSSRTMALGSTQTLT